MTPWTVALQAPLSMGFPRQEYWSGLPFPSPGDLPDPRTKPVFSSMRCIMLFLHLNHLLLFCIFVVSGLNCELFMTFHNLIPPLLSEDVSIIVVFYRSPSLLWSHHQEGPLVYLCRIDCGLPHRRYCCPKDLPCPGLLHHGCWVPHSLPDNYSLPSVVFSFNFCSFQLELYFLKVGTFLLAPWHTAQQWANNRSQTILNPFFCSSI